MKEEYILSQPIKIAQQKGYVVPNASFDTVAKMFNLTAHTLLQKWLREKHNIYVEVQLDQTTTPKFAVEIYKYMHFGNYNKVIQKDWCLYRTYEEAVEAGLLEALKLI